MSIETIESFEQEMAVEMKEAERLNRLISIGEYISEGGSYTEWLTQTKNLTKVNCSGKLLI